MRKFITIVTCAFALMIAPLASGMDQARAIDADDLFKGIVGGIIAGAIINHAVRHGQRHCHEGRNYYCHSHGGARAYHYHQYSQGPILYYQASRPAPPPPPPSYGGGYPPAHYQWCQNSYRTYDIGSNSYIPCVGCARVPCRSPYVR